MTKSNVFSLIGVGVLHASSHELHGVGVPGTRLFAYVCPTDAYLLSTRTV